MALNRPLAAPHLGHRFRTSPSGAADTYCLFKCDEAAAGNGMVDAAGGTTLTDSGAVGVTQSLFDKQGTIGARQFTGANRQSRAGGVPDAAVFTGTAYTWGGYVFRGAGGGNVAIFEYGGVDAGAETLTGNKLFGVRLNAATNMEVYWEQGVGVDVVADSGIAVELSVVHLWGITVDNDPVNAGQRRVRFYRDGVKVATVSNLTPAAGGTLTPELSVGAANPAGVVGSFFIGNLDDIVVEKWAAEDDWHMEQYGRGVRDYDESVVHQARAFQVVQRVLIQDTDLNWRDFSTLFGRNRVIATMCHDSTDNPGMTAEVHLKRQMFAFNLSPKVSGSPDNKDAAGANIELLQSRRRIKVQRAVIPMGRTLATWMYETRFDGFIDRIRYADDPVVLECIGLQLALQDVFILDETDYSLISRLLEAQCQAIIDDWRPGSGANPSPTPGYKGEANGTNTPKVYTPTSPAWLLGGYFQSTKKVWEALQALVEQLGWRLSERWDDHRQAFRPTIYQPDRSKASPDRTISPYEIIDVKKLEHSASDVRNKVRVRLPHEVTQTDPAEPTVGGVLDITVQDSTSIAKYGLLACSIGEASGANVNTSAEGTTLANGALNDMKEPLADGEFDLRYQSWCEVEDLLRFSRDDRRWDGNLDLAIQSFDDEVREGTARTTISLSQKPKAKSNRFWGGRLVGPTGHPFRKRTALSPQTAPTTVALAGGVLISWAQPDGIIGFGNAYDRTEIHQSLANGFTPTNATLKAVVRNQSHVVLNLQGTVTNYFVVVHRDIRGNRSVSAQAARVPRYTTLNPGATMVRNAADYDPGAGKTIVQLDSALLDNWSNVTPASFLFTAPVVGIYAVNAQLHCTDTISSTVNLEINLSSHGELIAGPAVSGTAIFPAVHSVVHVPAGGTIRLNANVTVHGSANFRIKGALDVDTFMEINYLGPNS